MKVYDLFTFNDELDLLELRLMELSDVVDIHVLAELPHTFMQAEKPLHFRDNAARFSKYLGKIRVIEPKSYPVGPHPTIEHFQRRLLSSGIGDAEPDDLILLGDVDEIPSVEVIENLKANPVGHPVTCRQRLYYYYVNLEMTQPWNGTVAFQRKTKDAIDCEEFRQARHFFPIAPFGGWHFSWLGNAEQIGNKLRSIDVTADAKLYGTPEIVKPDPDDSSFIERCRTEHLDLFGRENSYATKVPVDIVPGKAQPRTIIEWLRDHPHYALARA